MKNSFRALPFLLLFLSACASPEEGPPAEAGDFPPEYVITAEDAVPGDTKSDVEDPDAEGDESDAEGTEGEGGVSEGEGSAEARLELLECREQNAEISLEMEAQQKRLDLCQQELATKNAEVSDSSPLAGLDESHLSLIKEAILSTEQPEYPFRSCGQVGTFLRSGWFDDFSTKLLNEKIRFSNGFLETDDLFGGCESSEGKMAFFLGAERESDIRFIIIKYDTEAQSVTPALMMDNAGEAVVTAFGKREGPFVNFPADDGRVFRYYYDANIVIQAP